MSYLKLFSALTATFILSTTIASTALAQEATQTRTRTNSQGGSVTETRSRGNGVSTRSVTVTDADGNSKTRTMNGPRPSRRPPVRGPHGRPIRRGIR